MASKVTFPPANNGDPGMAVNGAQNRIYIANGSTQVKAYDVDSAALVETIDVGSGVDDVAVDEATDTLFTAGAGVIKEIVGVVVPDLTTSAPTGTATLNGHVDPAGGGDVISCKFEFSTSADYTPATTQTKDCTPAIPPNYSAPTDVSANLNGLVAGETLYHYRLVASNANGTNRSADATFTPHFVAQLHTAAATEIDRESARLNGSFLGTGEDTHYYFEWGTEAPAYGHTTPVEDAGITNSMTNVSAVLSNVLDPETTYHYRVVASNSQGTSTGQDETFQTRPAVFDLETEPATNVRTTTAELNATFTGDGIDTTYYFEWGSSTLYGNNTSVGEITAPSGPTSIPATLIEELQPLHTYHYRVVAENSFGTTYGADRTLTTFSPPVVVSQTSSGVRGTTATLHATINPHGADTEYYFEYGSTLEYGNVAPIPHGEILSGETPVAVEADLTGLNGGVYHFRVVAISEYGVTKSNDQTFNFYPPQCPNSSVRQQTGANTLPDCRAYELVTPEDQGITIIYPSQVPFSATATSPSRLGFVGSFGLIPNSGEPANNVGDMYFATRTSNGWKTKFVGIPSSASSLAGGPPWHVAGYTPDKFQEFTLADQDLSTFVDWHDGIFSIGELYEEEHPGSSNAPYVWDTTTGKQVDRWPTNVGAVPGGEFFNGRTAASADLSHFVFTSDIPFAPGGIPGDMYDNDTGHNTVKVISRLESGEHIANTMPLEVSEDGSHILMVVRPGSPLPLEGPGELYMRSNDMATYEIAPGESVEYLGMTPNGKKVYFATTSSLLAEDPDTSRDLYMWDEDGPSPTHLTLISKGNEPTAGNTDACSASWTEKCDIEAINFDSYTSAQGGLGGNRFAENFIASENGDIYYLSPEQLHGANGVNGMQNLYVYRHGKNQFVAALDPAGIACTVGLQGGPCSENAVARMEVTSDDSFMAFLTASNVTGYDSQGKSELYLYRPATEEMECVSCIPSGEPPSSDVYASHNGKYLTDDGRTFFETKDALVPQDTNEASDVYEFVEGRPQLITTGTNVGNETFGLATIMALPGLVGVSADGTDVFIATYDVLVGQDRNGEAIKIYDARSGGGFQFTPPVPPCVAADECHGPGSEAPVIPANGTGSNLGAAGNVQSGGSLSAKSGKKRKNARKKRQKKKHKRKGQGSGDRNG
jgi:hypothetical protein